MAYFYSSDVLARRIRFCNGRIGKISNGLVKVAKKSFPGDLCSYVTGSFGRLEASAHSDVDVFFVLNNADSKNAKLAFVDQCHIFSALDDICREIGFPEFSNDGEFLRVHELGSILSNVGKPSDDASNNFTARMLLLLESRPLVNDTTYRRVIKHVIDAYWRDYPDHDTNFRPVFLMNDVARFWKTLCLNYESKRNLKSLGQHDRAKATFKNLKLKYSRLLTCYSLITELLAASSPLGPAKMLEIVRRTPVERLVHVASADQMKRSPIRTHVTEILDSYSWFLDATGRSESDMVSWLQDDNNRQDAFERAQRFGEMMFALLLAVCEREDRRPMLRYLVI
jgi:hypothetical protein